MSNASTKVYEQVADYIISQLENGVVPWRKPWTLPPGMFPQNLSGRAYTGINSLMLGMTTYQDPRWLTFRKAKELGGSIKRGERGMRIVFWKQIEIPDRDSEDGAIKRIGMLKTYTVFNASQCEGLPLPEIATPTTTTEWNAIEEAEAIIAAMPTPPSITEDGGTAAFYRVTEDGIHMPPKYAFENGEEWYSTLFHELSHSTGNPKRLNRDTINQTASFGSPTYSKEELVAEFGSAYLCQMSGIENTLENSAAYIGGWLKKLRDDKRLVITAASQGQKAADYVLGRKGND